MDDKANERRRRGVWLGLLVVLLLALGGYAYAQSSSPSASTGPGKAGPSATPSATPSVTVLAPTQTAQPKPSGSTGSTDLGTTSTGQSLVLAPQAAGNNGNGNGNGNGNNPCVDPASESPSCPHTFGVRVGQSPLLYPSVARNLPVTFVNPNNFAISVTSYRVSVVVPGAAATSCPASNLQVPAGTVSLNPGLAVAKNATTATTVPIKLAATAPAACQNVSFTITVNASAVKK
jgi:hypothetical protein